MKLKTLKKACIVAITLPILATAGGDVAPIAPDSDSNWIDAIGFSYGRSKDKIDIYRLTLRRDFESKWMESDSGYLSGYWEGSLNYWNGRGTDNYGVALSPVFDYYFNTESGIKPYLEAGVGVSYFARTKMGIRNLSSHFLFEDRIGLGVRVDNMDYSLRYMHYSNAGMKQPNHGIDIFIGSVSYKF